VLRAPAPRALLALPLPSPALKALRLGGLQRPVSPLPPAPLAAVERRLVHRRLVQRRPAQRRPVQRRPVQRRMAQRPGLLLRV